MNHEEALRTILQGDGRTMPWQAVALLREMRKKSDLLKEALSYLESLPIKWKKLIKMEIDKYIPDFLT